MASEQERLAQIFIWRQATAPDIEYARQLLSVVNPDAARLLATVNPPIRLFSIFGPWPSDPWGPAIRDMRATPAPNGTHWNDTTQYDLAGWQGTDSRTGEHLFVVTAYRKANAPATGAFQGAPTPAPSHLQPSTSLPQVPYYPHRPTGPIDWPPSELTAPQAKAPQSLVETGQAVMPYHTQNYQGATGPLANAGAAPTEPSPEGFGPYYAGFQPRLIAWLIDLACIAVFCIGALLIYMWLIGETNPKDFGGWLGTYWGYFLIIVAIFAVYHIVQWSAWGQTLGMSLLNIRVVDRNGDKPELGRSVLRMMAYFPPGYLQIAYQPRRQALHDTIAETYVVPESPAAPVPAGMPGYPPSALSQTREVSTAIGAVPGSVTDVMPALGMATMAGTQPYGEVRISPEEPAQEASRGTGQREGEQSIFREIASIDQSLKTVVMLPDLPEEMPSNVTGPLSTTPDLISAAATGPLTEQALLQQADRLSGMERARELFRQGMEQLEAGVQQSEYGYRVEASAARRAAQAFQAATQLVPGSVVYHYFLGVALRYAEGFEIAIREFRLVLELDPGHYEARQQIAYGPRWHDAFAYPPWSETPGIKVGDTAPEPILALLPANNEPVTRLVLLREGNSKVVSVLSRTPRSSWAKPLGPDLPAHIDMVLSRTPSGPIIAFYIVVEDRATDPYKGETFLNPHDPGGPAFDACQLGQNLLSQLHRQERTYLIFVDEENKLSMSRRLDFDPQTQVNINRCLYEVQTLPAQIMDIERFQSAAEWHMEHFSLDQVK